MPGRLPTQGVLVSNGSAGQKYVYVVIFLDQDYLVESVGSFPDAGSLSGQLSVHIGNFRGPMPSAVTTAVSGPNKTDFGANGLQITQTFGPEVERLLGDMTDQLNFLTPLWGTVNPKWYDRRARPILRSGTSLVVIMFDTKNGDNVTRAVQYELVAYPIPPDETQDYVSAKGA